MTVGTDRRGDRRHLAHAIALAQTAQRRASPNPGVGCVLARGSTIVATGATHAAGGSHAEAVALSRAPAHLARGATAYVSLAPCAHQGRTPPCADALIEAGIARAVIALDDPHRAASGGIHRLQQAGIDVLLDDPRSPMALAVASQLEGFLTAVTQQRPHVTLKIAQCADGSIATTDRRWITAAPARRAVHRWRASADGVLVGIGTVLADDPALTVRHVATSAPQPRVVVIDSMLRTPPAATVVRPGTVVVTTSHHAPAAATALEARGVTVVPVADDLAGGVDLRAALRALADMGMLRVFAEPGPRLAQALIDAGLVDRFVEHVAACDDASIITSALAWPSDQPRHLERIGGAGPDMILQWLRLRTLDGAHLAETH